MKFTKIFVDWIGGWAKLVDALVLIFTLGHYNPRLNYKWYYPSASKTINGHL